MNKEFTRKDLHTGDIVENRGGRRGVVITELDCIIYQSGGLDIMKEAFTDDLFINGSDRSGDIFKVYHDPEGPLGFNKLFGLEPVFVRKNDKHTKERAAELSARYDGTTEKVTCLVLEPAYRRCEESFVTPFDQKDIDMLMSAAPSMTAMGQLRTDKTFVRVPHTDNLFLLYNRFQEEWFLQTHNDSEFSGKKITPVIAIPEEHLEVCSRCLIVRKDNSGQIINLQEGDLEKVKEYMVQMGETDKNNKAIK